MKFGKQNFDSDVIFIFVVDRVKDQAVIAKMYATDKVLFTGGAFSINNCKFEKSDQIELLKVSYPKNRIWNFGAEKLLKCRKTNETYFYLSTCGNIERRVDVADVTSHNHFNNKNYFYSYEEIKKYKEALKKFNTQWHEDN